MNGERYTDNGWRRLVNDWGLVITFLTVIFWAGVSYNAIAENTKGREDTAKALETVAQSLKTQAEINGRVEGSVKALQETVRALLDRQLRSPQAGLEERR